MIKRPDRKKSRRQITAREFCSEVEKAKRKRNKRSTFPIITHQNRLTAFPSAVAFLSTAVHSSSELMITAEPPIFWLFVLLVRKRERERREREKKEQRESESERERLFFISLESSFFLFFDLDFDPSLE